MTNFKVCNHVTLEIPVDQLEMFAHAWSGMVAANRNGQWAGMDDIYGDFYGICKRMVGSWFCFTGVAATGSPYDDKIEEIWNNIQLNTLELVTHNDVLNALRDAVEQTKDEDGDCIDIYSLEERKECM